MVDESLGAHWVLAQLKSGLRADLGELEIGGEDRIAEILFRMQGRIAQAGGILTRARSEPGGPVGGGR